MTARLLFFRSRSNFFLVLSDSNNNCVFSCSSGIAKLGDNKKQKVSAQNVWKFISFFKPFFVLYKIKFINFYLRCRKSKHLFQLFNYLEMIGIEIVSFERILNRPHNGIRPRKLRRV